jgi:UDP-N-acetylmuramoyl-tripeptide--D-alanyl-D-alanine ligase
VIVGVAGAVGKTTTKLAIATVLSQKYRVLTQDGSFNDEIGLPLACFDLDLPAHILNPFSWAWLLVCMEAIIHRPSPYDVLVIEIGTDAPSEIPHTLSYLRPDIGIITAVAPEHMEYFETLDAVAAEELAIAGASKQIVAGLDSIAAKYRHKYLDSHPAHFYYGLSREADYGFEVAGTEPLGGTTGALLKNGHTRIAGITTALYGLHSAKAAAAAYAVGDLLGLTPAQLKTGFQAIRPVRGRMNPLQGKDGSRLIDDSYNSSPGSLAAALAALADAPAIGRRIAILGSMNELGSESPRYHEEAGKAAASLDLLITIGHLANTCLGPAAVRAGLDPTRFIPADSPYAAGRHVALLLQPGDVVLVKGSQNGVFAEEAVKILLENPADAAKLVRQSPAWQRIKAAAFPDGQQ